MLSSLIRKILPSKNNNIKGDTPPKSELVGESGGAWTEETHLALHEKNFNKGLADFVINEFEFEDALEFGSGLGLLASYICNNKEVENYHCIEPNQITGKYNDTKPKLFSINIFEDSIPGVMEKKYELVCSIEVAEHIDRTLHDQLFDFLVSRANKWIVFSGARVGQGGHGHIAERDYEDWKSEFTKRGCVYDPQLSEQIRKACDEKNINHRVNLQVYKVGQ